MKRAHWDRLEKTARRVVAATLAELPAEIRGEAAGVP